MRERKIVALYSGGLDSTVMIYHLREVYNCPILPISVLYGQKHARELVAAREVCEFGGFEFKLIDLSNVQEILKGSSQTDSDVEVPEGHYSADNMAITVVPNRNMILLSIATAYAISIKSGWVAYAAHSGDHAQYPDCRQVFIDAMEEAIDLCDDNSPALLAPFAALSKAQIVLQGHELKVPMGKTWSCYKGAGRHCGRCGTCVERAEAFHLAQVVDPTSYVDPYFWKEVTKKTAKKEA